MAPLVTYLWDEGALRTWCVEDWAKAVDRTFVEVRGCARTPRAWFRAASWRAAA